MKVQLFFLTAKGAKKELDDNSLCRSNKIETTADVHHSSVNTQYQPLEALEPKPVIPTKSKFKSILGKSGSGFLGSDNGAYPRTQGLNGLNRIHHILA